MLLASEGLEFHAVQYVTVLGRRITGHVGVLRQQHAVNVAEVQGCIHAVVRLVHVVHVRRALCQL